MAVSRTLANLSYRSDHTGESQKRINDTIHSIHNRYSGQQVFSGQFDVHRIYLCEEGVIEVYNTEAEIDRTILLYALDSERVRRMAHVIGLHESRSAGDLP